MSEPRLGVIGGSGLYEMKGLKDVREVRVETPFGDPSDSFILGSLEGIPMAFLPRHGHGHRIQPSDLNYRANIWGMKTLGVEWIVGVSAVGSMKEEIRPGDVVAVDQFIDRTRHRPDTFFGEGVVVHVALGDPVCGPLHAALIAASEEAGSRVHRRGTYLCMEGPQFSTRAESFLYKSWGVDVIGMTNLQEARLAREAEICYATIALATDYDCWHEVEDDVSAENIIKVLRKNVAAAREILKLVAPRRPSPRKCPCTNALAGAIITDPGSISAGTKERLGLLLGKYID
ncbi:MAG: S-methyl-5'-thioadenosine phosphorylase [Myxococcota bacterium]